MSWQPTPYAIILAVSAAVCIVLSYISWRWRETRGASVLALLMLAIAEWDLTVAFESAAVQESQKILWSELSYIGIVASPVLLLLFVLRYSHSDRELTPLASASLWVIPIVTAVLALTNERHHLIWARVALHADSGKNVLVYDYGLWFWLWLAYAYCLLAVSSFVLIRMALQYRRAYRMQAALLLLGILLAWIGNGLYMAGVGLFSGQDLTPLSFALGVALLVLNICYFRLFDLVPVACKAVIESMDEGVLVLDGKYRLVFANPAARRLLGLEAASVGQSIEEALSRWPALVEACRDEARMQCEAHEQGILPCYLDVRFSPLRNGRGRVSGRLMVMSDITKRKELEQRLRQAQKMEAVGRLAGGIAHEFNNLLTVINGYTEMSLGALEKDGNDGAVYGELEQVLGAGRRAAELTDQLLTFSRRRAMKVEVVDPREVLEDMGGMLQQVVTENIQLEIGIGENLGEVRVDRGRLEEVIVNLVTNAQDAIREKDGGDRTIAIEAQNANIAAPRKGGYLPVERGQYVLIKVRDTGLGMSDDVQERIFEPFFTTKEVGEGTGLGLAIVYSIVKEFGGGIEVQSERGRGTSVRIYVPRVE